MFLQALTVYLVDRYKEIKWGKRTAVRWPSPQKLNHPIASDSSYWPSSNNNTTHITNGKVQILSQKDLKFMLQLSKYQPLKSFFFPQPKAPVLTRACYLLECAHFVYQCNRGQWPSWLKMNLPTYRPSRGGWPPPSTQLPIQRRALAMQLQASKMFHQWAEVSST